MADYLDRLRMNRMYTGVKEEVVKVLAHVPLLGDQVERFLAQLKEAAKAGLHGGMLFEDLGFRYFGPIDGHNIGLVRKYLRMARQAEDQFCCTSSRKKDTDSSRPPKIPCCFMRHPSSSARQTRSCA